MVVTEKGFDEYFQKVMPLVSAISLMKTFLSEDIAKQVTAHVEKTDRRALTTDEKKIIQRAADAAVATLNPDIFKVDVNWSPRSAEEVKKKLVELKLGSNFKQSLTDAVLRVFRDPQGRL